MRHRVIALFFTVAIAIGLSAPAVARVECVAMASACVRPCPDCPEQESAQAPTIKATCCQIRAAPDSQLGEAPQHKISNHQLPALPLALVRAWSVPADAPVLPVFELRICSSPPQVNRPLLR
jgi:hypothetical protein